MISPTLRVILLSKIGTNTVMHITQGKIGHDDEIVKSPITPITIHRNCFKQSPDQKLTKSSSKNDIKMKQDYKKVENEEWNEILKSLQITIRYLVL